MPDITTMREPEQTASQVLVLGRACFPDARLATLARTEGAASAWRAALAQGPARAAACARGDFAIALPDALGRCFLAVDRFATRPLCYRVIGGRLHFSERADTLAALAPAAPLAPQALFDYLYHHVIPSPRTAFEGVYRMPPAHYAWFDRGHLTVERYWAPQFLEPRTADLVELSYEFRNLVQQAVAARLGAGRPACFLSGGTDSSTVAGMIGRVAGQPAATYSIGFEADGYDEMAFARIAAKHFGTEHHEYYVTPDDLVRSVPAVAAHYDQPFGNSSVLPAYYCAKMARDDGVTRLLAGDGGDELFGGNARYAKQRIFGWYDAVPSPIRAAALEPCLVRSKAGTWPVLRKGRSYVEQARVPLPDRLQQYNLLLRLGIDEVLTAGFLDRVDQAAPLLQQREVWAHPQGAGALNRMLAYDWRYTLAEADLPKVVGSTALAGIETAFPMLDDALLDFSLSLPPAYKLKGLKLRWFFKRALRGFLPDEILRKKKQGFGLPFGVWATRHAGLRALATDSLRSLATRGIVHPAFIDRLLTQHLQAHPGYFGEMVWILMLLEQWLQSHAPKVKFI